eukprot:m.111850 g.111850  ORF g.111850 m.111850 type:complete len:80 (-) comp28150_c0_seq2:185-424(-)
MYVCMYTITQPTTSPFFESFVLSIIRTMTSTNCTLKVFVIVSSNLDQTMNYELHRLLSVSYLPRNTHTPHTYTHAAFKF